jgi:hypothetical protein
MALDLTKALITALTTSKKKELHVITPGDIVGAFNNIKINKLINILRKSIDDAKWRQPNLIKQGCLCGLL